MIDHRIVMLERERDPQQRDAPFNDKFYELDNLKRRKLDLEFQLEELEGQIDELRLELERNGFVV